MATGKPTRDNHKDATMSSNKEAETQPPGGAQAPISSEALLKGNNEIEILHENQIYRLRRTSKGKLIMTK